MKRNIVMPKLGLTMEEATIMEWNIKVGDSFNKGDTIFEVTTDKATVEVEAQFSGKLLEIVVDEEESAKVSAVVAYAEEE